MHRNPFTVRRLGSGDVQTLRGLNTVFGEAFADRETYGSEPPSDDYLAALLGKEHVAFLVAEADGAIIGGLVAYELDKFERARREFYIYDLAVASDHRRRGIATSLIDRLRGIAEQRDVWVICVQADHGDDPAVALYEKLGTREDVMHFDIAVTPCSR